MKKFSSARTVLVVLTLLTLASKVGVAQVAMNGGVFGAGGQGINGGIGMAGIAGQPVSGNSGLQTHNLMHGFFLGGAAAVLLVGLDELTVIAQGNGQGPMVKWVTSAEFDNVGFNVYRAVRGGSGWMLGPRINPSTIPAAGNETLGATYQFYDTDAYFYGTGPRGYYLEDIDLLGGSTFHGPVFIEQEAVTSSVSDWALF